MERGSFCWPGLLRRDDGGIGREHEVDARVGHQVGLELRDVHVQGPIEAKAGREGADDLGNETVQVGVGRPLNVQVPAEGVKHDKELYGVSSRARPSRNAPHVKPIGSRSTSMPQDSCGKYRKELRCRT